MTQPDILKHNAGLGGSFRCASDWGSRGCGFDPRRVGNILSWRFDHEIFSTDILSLPLRRTVISFLRKKEHNTG